VTPILLVTERDCIRDLMTRALRREAHLRVVTPDMWLKSEMGSLSANLVILDLPDRTAAHQLLTPAETAVQSGAGGLVLILNQALLDCFEPGQAVDAYLVEPFCEAEAVLRIRMVLRRFQPDSDSAPIRIRGLYINPAGYEVSLNDIPLTLTFKEFELLRFLASHTDRVFTRDELLSLVWGEDYFGGTRTVDVHVRRLRSKLGSRYEALLQTVRNVGYRFSVPAGF
jgi:DNA-binding response OmpR family regulator